MNVDQLPPPSFISLLLQIGWHDMFVWRLYFPMSKLTVSTN